MNRIDHFPSVKDQICPGCLHREALFVVQDSKHWSPLDGYRTKDQIRCPKTCPRLTGAVKTLEAV